MSWERNTPRPRTSGWAEQRRAQAIIARDGGICHVCGGSGADEADHVIPLTEHGANDPANMAAIHAVPCHRDKSQAEAARARARSRPSRRRPEEPHPGGVSLSKPRLRGKRGRR